MKFTAISKVCWFSSWSLKQRFFVHKTASLGKKRLKERRIQVTGLRERAAREESGNVEAVEAQQLVQPLLHGVSGRVANGLVQRRLVQRASCDQTTVRRQNGARDDHGGDVSANLLPAWPCWWAGCRPTCSAGSLRSAASAAGSVWGTASARCLRTYEQPNTKTPGCCRLLDWLLL